jgi:hypothetical protein
MLEALGRPRILAAKREKMIAERLARRLAQVMLSVASAFRIRLCANLPAGHNDELQPHALHPAGREQRECSGRKRG